MTSILPRLKALVGPKAPAMQPIAAVIDAVGGATIEDSSGKHLFGETTGPSRVAITVDGTTVGWVNAGNATAAGAIALLVSHLAAGDMERRALSREVLHLYREVNLIEKLSEQLAALLELESVGKSALDQARRLIAGSYGDVFIVEPGGAQLRSIASFGDHVPDVQDFLRSVLARGVAEIVNDAAADPRTASDASFRSLVCVPLRATHRTVGLICMTNTDETPYAAADLKLLNTLALQTAAAIENTLLCAEMVDAVRDREQLASIQKELDTARTIQHSLVPRVFPPFPERTDFEIHAQMTAARSVGGDFFDFFLIDNDRLGVVIGDVSGKGIPAALYMAVTRTQIKTSALGGMSPEDCMLEVNRLLVREKASSMFATCFYGILNTRNGEFRYCNAGHNPPQVLRHADGSLESLSETGGLPLGLFDGRPYVGTMTQLRPGDSVFLFTDGVTEANNFALDDFSDERLADVLRSVAHRSCEEIVMTVNNEVLAFAAGAPQSDDITMMSLRRR